MTSSPGIRGATASDGSGSSASSLSRVGWRIGLAVVVALFFLPLFDARNALATRDMLALHLPLRAAWKSLVEIGGTLFPQWDPFSHGGQPLLSNPQYGALYPPSWIALVLSPARAVAWLALGHAVLAAFGAARLARRFGAGPPAATLAAIAFSCGPTYLALLHSLPLALGMSWFPWVLALADEHLASRSTARTEPMRAPGARSALAFAFALALLILSSGEPALLVLTALALMLLVVSEPGRRSERLVALAGPGALGLGLAAIQLAPSLARLAESSRGAGLDLELATRWSLPWLRLPEIALPRLYGDVSRPMDLLYFGWGIHDLDYPFLLLLASGTPLLVGALALLFAGDRRRALLVALAASGLFLALGRHNLLFVGLGAAAPSLIVVRYPEKFALLALAALILAGAAAWQRLLDERERPREARRLARFAERFGWGALALAAGWALALRLAPARLESFLRAHGGGALDASGVGGVAGGVRFLHEASLVAVAFALGTVAIVRLARDRRRARLALELAVIALVAGELWIYSRPLLRTIPAADLLAPPAALLEPPALRRGTRLFASAAAPDAAALGVPRTEDPALAWARTEIDTLAPRSANLLGLSYALDRDFDRTLTRPAERALELAARVASAPALASRLLGAWGIERSIVRRDRRAILAEARRGEKRIARVELVRNPFALPRVRFVPGYETFPDPASAERAAIGAGLPLERLEFLVAAPPSAPPGLGIGSIVADDERGDRRRIAYRADGPALLVVATTFDPRWSAQLGGETMPIFETAGGYQALLVPAGAGELELRFRDPWFAAGAGASGVALLVALLLFLRGRAPVSPRGAPAPMSSSGAPAP